VSLSLLTQAISSTCRSPIDYQDLHMMGWELYRQQ